MAWTARTRTALGALAAGLLLAPAAWALGELSQKPGTAGCVSETGSGGSCQNGRALQGPWGVAASPDGKNVYVASVGSGALAVFDRAPSGALTQKAGIAGCVSDDGSGGVCRDGIALLGAGGVATSPDGRSVYVAATDSGAVAVFDRAPNGALTEAGCVSESGSGGACQDGAALAPSGVVVSPDGRNLYAVSPNANAVAVFDRDPATGALSQQAGVDGCVSEDGSGGVCRDGIALVFARAVTVSADGKSVYVASLVSDAVAIFDREPATGALTQKAGTAGCVSEDGSGGACQDGAALDGAFGVAASPDGASVYVAASNSDAVAVLARDRASGALSPAGCVSDAGGSCEKRSGLDAAAGVTAGPDVVYIAAAESDAVVALYRDPATGDLTSRPVLGCVAEIGTSACQDGTALDGAVGVAASPDGRNVYVASLLSHAVAVLDRPSPPSPPPPLPAPSRDTVAPTVRHVAVTPRRFRAGHGSRLRFTLSEPAAVRVVITRGRRRVRSIARRNLPAGRRSVRFRGRGLAPGRYRAAISATDRAGNRSRPARAAFRVVRRRS